MGAEAITFMSRIERRDGLKMSGCLDQEVPVQEIRQAGLSSAGNDEDGDNFQAGQ